MVEPLEMTSIILPIPLATIIGIVVVPAAIVVFAAMVVASAPSVLEVIAKRLRGRI